MEEEKPELSIEFEDLLPVIVARLGTEGLMVELCKGFQLLMDPAKGVITADSLRRSSATALGLGGCITEEEVVSMVREGDLNRDGVLDQMEFCVLMLRLSPELMDMHERWS